MQKKWYHDAADKRKQCILFLLKTVHLSSAIQRSFSITAIPVEKTNLNNSVGKLVPTLE